MHINDQKINIILLPRADDQLEDLTLSYGHCAITAKPSTVAFEHISDYDYIDATKVAKQK